MYLCILCLRKSHCGLQIISRSARAEYKTKIPAKRRKNTAMWLKPEYGNRKSTMDRPVAIRKQKIISLHMSLFSQKSSLFLVYHIIFQSLNRFIKHAVLFGDETTQFHFHEEGEGLFVGVGKLSNDGIVVFGFLKEGEDIQLFLSEELR